MRIQCERAQTQDIHGYLRREGYQPREDYLIREYGASWWRPLTRATVWRNFLRGLPLVSFRHVHFTNEDMNNALQRINPLNRIELPLIDTTGEQRDYSPGQSIEERLRHPIMLRVSTMVVIRCSPAGMRLIAECPHLPNLERILFGRMPAEARDLCRDLVEPHVPVKVTGEGKSPKAPVTFWQG